MVENKENKYLNIQIVGHTLVRAFRNEKKDKAEQPDFVGNGVAVWVNTAKDKVIPVKEERVVVNDL